MAPRHTSPNLNRRKIPNGTTRTLADWEQNKLYPLRRVSPLHKDNEHTKTVQFQEMK